MKHFLIKIAFFSIPILLLIGVIIYMDFFKIHGFQEYYPNKKVGVNREMVTTTTYNHYRKTEKFDSFIFGSSRSQAYKCKNWLPHLKNSSKAFHFDASGEGIWGISKKIEYIDQCGDTIKNALIAIDRFGLTVTYPRKGHLFVSMPCVSKASFIGYYFEFLKASINPKFLLSYIDFSIFKTFRSYMKSYISGSKYNDIANSKNCDIWDGWDKEIAIDSLGYYKNLINKGVFYKRPNPILSKCELTPEEVEQLLSIKNIFDKHKTQFKIVISPIYDQVPMEKNQIRLLEKIFGKKNVYNFSGKNLWTEPISNYYETSHFRPLVANGIMNIIYQKPSL